MSTARNAKNNQSQKSTTIPPLDQLKVYSNQDILICGNCRELFSELHDLLEHKKTYCKLRFTCKCDTNKSKSHLDDQTTAALLCVQCKDGFQNAWDLMVHAQAAHMLNIYELGIPNNGRCTSPASPRDNNSPEKVGLGSRCLLRAPGQTDYVYLNDIRDSSTYDYSEQKPLFVFGSFSTL
nr:unnamed protein product [Callosobruchus chinensis]